MAKYIVPRTDETAVNQRVESENWVLAGRLQIVNVAWVEAIATSRLP
jgi:hypothetical protein